MEAMGFPLTHLDGLTESYGPATICAWQPEWDGLPLPERAVHAARQGVANPTLDGLLVPDPDQLAPVPRDGATLGEVMLRGNTVMKAHPALDATEEALRGGWFHTGDLAVWQPDGYIEIKDRSKDIIISGGENVSSLEVEEVLYRHPAVMESAVVAKPDPRWGETLCAFVTLRTGGVARYDRCHRRLVPGAPRALQGAAGCRVRPASEDLDRQDPEVHPARAGESGGLT